MCSILAKRMKNNKGKKAGSGTVSNARRARFREAGMKRENDTMEKEDEHSKKVDWEKDKRHGNKKPHLMSALEIKYNLASKEEKAELKKDMEKEKHAAFDKKAVKPEDVKEAAVDKTVVKEEPTAAEQKDALTKGSDAPEQKDALTKGSDAPKTFGPSKEQLKKGKEPEREKKPPVQEVVDWGASSSSEYEYYTETESESEESPPKKSRSQSPLDKRGQKKWVQKESPPLALQEAEKAAVDWHHTLEWHDNVSPQNIRALDALKDAGYQVYLCSFSGWDRAQETKRLSWKVWQGWEKQIYTTEKTGNYGKAQACYYHNIKTVFDDTWEVIDECSRWGVETYPVVSKWDEKYWEGIDTYRSFAQAVQAFLDKR